MEIKKSAHIYNFILAILTGAAFWIKFIPLAIAIIAAVIFTLFISVEKVRKDGPPSNIKYAIMAIGYLAIFMVIFLFMYLHKIPMYFEQ